MKFVFWIFLIIVLAVSLRSYRVQFLTTFQGDQGRDLANVAEMLTTPRPLLLGHPASVGLYNGPIYFYLLAPFMIISRLDPLGGALAVIFFNIFGLIILAVVCKRFISHKVALLSAFLFASSPLMVEFGRSLLPPYLSPPFFFLWLYAIFYLSKRQKLWTALMIGISLGFLIQLHYLFAFLILPTLFMTFQLQQINKLFRYILLVSLSLMMTYVPYIIFELRHNFINLRLLWMFLVGTKFQNFLFINARDFSLSTVGYLFGPESAQYGLIIMSIIALSLIYNNSPSIKRRLLVPLVLFVSYFFVIIGLRVPIEWPAYHYLLPGVLCLFILVPVSILCLPRLVSLTVLSLMSLFIFSSYNLKRDHGFTMVAGWNLPKQKELAILIADDLETPESFQIASMIDGDTQAFHLRYLLNLKGYRPLGVDAYDRASTLYLVTRDDPTAVYNYRIYEVNSLRPFAVTKTWHLDKNIYLIRIDRLNKS